MDNANDGITLISDTYDQLSNKFKNSYVKLSHKLINRDDTFWERVLPLAAVTGEPLGQGANVAMFKENVRNLSEEKLRNTDHIRIVTTEVAMNKTKKLDLNQLEQDLKNYNEELNSFASNDPAFTLSLTILGISDQIATKVTQPSTFEAVARRFMSGKLNIITLKTVRTEYPKIVGNLIDEKVKFLMAFVNMPYLEIFNPTITKQDLNKFNPVLIDGIKTLHELGVDNGLIEKIEEE